jgi:hypothetical protein
MTRYRMKHQDERLVDSREHFTFNDPAHPTGVWVRNELYHHYLPGDVVRHDVAAPGIGHITYRIVRCDEQGAWGVVIDNTVRDLTPEETR